MYKVYETCYRNKFDACAGVESLGMERVMVFRVEVGFHLMLLSGRD